jgi:RNA polymerase sigma-70 factor (ECF subfamily)
VPAVAAEVAGFLAGIGKRVGHDDLAVELVEVNGQPGAVTLNPDGSIVAVVSIDVVDGKVHAVWSVVNPDKLTNAHDRRHARDFRPT